MEEFISSHLKWVKSLEKAVELDGWGQVVEAVEEYEALAHRMASIDLQSIPLEIIQKRIVKKTITVLQLRVKCLSSISDVDRPSKDDMSAVLPVFRDLPADGSKVFPVDMDCFLPEDIEAVSTSKPSVLEADTDMDEHSGVFSGGLLKKAAIPNSTTSYLQITIQKIGLKDADEYIDPYICVSSYDEETNLFEERQETAPSNKREYQYITFNTDVHIQTPFEKLRRENAAIFFEFMHYKPKKKKKSCRCWAMLEMDEVCNSEVVLELYKKPCDPKRKRINLFTVKPLYLHLKLEVRTC